MENPAPPQLNAGESDEDYIARKHVDEVLEELKRRILTVRPNSLSEFVIDRIEEVESMFDVSLRPAQKKRSRKNAIVASRHVSKLPLPPPQEHSEEDKKLIIKALSSCQLTFELTIDVLEEVEKYMVAVNFKPGARIISEGEKGDNFYIITDGICDIFKRNPNGEETLVNTLGKGLTFGELALIHDLPRRATVKARTDTRCFQLHGDHYRRIVRDTTESKIERYVNMLSKVRLMANLLPSEKAAVAASLKVVRFNPGDVIIRQGDIGEDFFMITKGRVTISKHSPDGTEVKICELGEGSSFGEASLLTSERRNATVTAGSWEPANEKEEKKSVAVGSIVECAVIDRFTFLGVIGPIANVIEHLQ